MKADETHPQAQEWIEERSNSAPTKEETSTAIHSLVDYIINWRIRAGLEQQHLEKASGMAKGSLSNNEGRKTMNLETFMRLAHGMGRKPSELAIMFLDRPDPSSATLRRDLDAPVVIAQPSVSAENLRRAVSEAAAIGELRRKKRANSSRSKAIVASTKKHRKG